MQFVVELVGPGRIRSEMDQHDVAVQTIGIHPFIFPNPAENLFAAEITLHFGGGVVAVGEGSGGV